MLYFPQMKNTTPQIGDFGATETALTAPLSVRSPSGLLSRGRTSKREEMAGSSNCVELFKQWANCYIFLFSIPFIIFVSIFSSG